MLVRYDCGCVGIPWGDSKGLLFRACDDEDSEPTMFLRNMEGKTFTELGKDEEELCIKGVQNLMNYGHRYLRLQDEFKLMHMTS